MKFKLLERKDTLIEDKEHGVSFRVAALLPEHVLEMQEIAGESRAASFAVALYAMRNCMSELTVGGEDINPRLVARDLDTRNMDASSTTLLYAIGNMVFREIMISDEVRKKLLPQPKTSSPSGKGLSEKAAIAAPSSEKG